MNTIPGQRCTRQRQLILQSLRELDCHPTADELYQRIRETLPRISLGTVYRNLDLLVRSGLVRRLAIAGSQARYDGDLSAHVHVRCVRCGGLDDVFVSESAARELPATSRNGFRITGCRVEYVGVCPNCVNDQSRADRESAVDPQILGPIPKEKNHVEEEN